MEARGAQRRRGPPLPFGAGFGDVAARKAGDLHLRGESASRRLFGVGVAGRALSRGRGLFAFGVACHGLLPPAKRSHCRVEVGDTVPDATLAQTVDGNNPDSGEVAKVSAGDGQEPCGLSGIQEPALYGFIDNLFFHCQLSAPVGAGAWLYALTCIEKPFRE